MNSQESLNQMKNQGRINGWGCEECGEYTYVIHVDEGTTPFYLGCRATERCSGLGKSLFYPNTPPPQRVKDQVKWEWYKPKRKEYNSLSKDVMDHVDRGGVLIRDLTEAGRKALEIA